MSFPKGQSSVEFLSIVGIALLISAPIILEAQERMIGIELTDEDAGLQDSIVDISQAIREVSSQDRYSKRTEQFRLGDDISSIEVLEDRVLKVSQNRSGELTYYTRQFDTDIEIQRIPKKEGLHELEVEFLGSKVVIEGDAERQSILQQVFSAVDSADWNQGIFSGTSADRNDNSGDLGLGYLNGTNPSSTNLEKGLVGYWRMDDAINGNGGTVTDYSGKGNNGTALGGVNTDVTGVFGSNSFEFDYSDQEYVDHLDISNQFDDEATISLWLKRSDVNTPSDSDATGIFNYGYNQNDDRSHYPWTDGNLYLSTFADDRLVDGLDNTGFDKTKWHHLLITTSPGTDNYRVYQNGSLIAEREGPESLTLPNNMRFGYSDASYYFNGKMDEVRLYNRSLTEDEVEKLYLRGKPFKGNYTSETIENSEQQDWNTLEIDASIPSSTHLTATFETLQDSLNFDTQQKYSENIDWNKGQFNKTTADTVPSTFKNISELEASTQSGFNEGEFNGTSADRKDNSGDLGLGYRNGSSGDDLVGYWRMDSNIVQDGMKLKDYSGNDGDAVIYNDLSLEPDGVFSSNARKFDGDNQRVEIPYSINSDSFSVSAWVTTEDFIDYRRFIESRNDANSRGFAFGLTNDGWSFWNAYSSSELAVNSARTNEWVHLVATHDGDSDETSVYVDGEIEATDSTDPMVGDTTGHSWIGNDEHYPEPWKGNIDELRVYNRSISESEVEDLYFSGRPFQGSYTAKEIDNSQETKWGSLEVNASIPSDTSVNASFRALDTNGNLVDSQLIDLSEGLNNYSLSVSNSEDAEVFINGTSSNVSRSWEIDSLEVFSSEVEEKNDGLRVGYRNGSLGDNLVGYWRLDRSVSGSGGMVKDYSGGNNDGSTVNGVNTGLEGVFSTNSFEFDGSDDYITQSDISADMKPVTISLWFKWDGGTGTFDRMWNAYDGNELALGMDHGQDSKGYSFYTYDGTVYGLDGVGDPPKNTWTHLVAVAGDTGNTGEATYRLYQNGELVANTTDSWTPTSLNPYIGNANGLDRPYNGELDEFRVYNSSLSESKIEGLYFQGMDGNFNGSYTAKEIDNSQETKWGSLEVNASIPSDTSVNASFRALDTDGGLVAEQDVDLGQGLNNYSLSVDSSEDAEVFINGTSNNVTKTWEVHSLEVFSSEVEDKNEGLRIGYQNGSAGDNLVGYWRLDRNVSGDGGMVKDYSGGNNDGSTVNGVGTGDTGTFSTNSVEFEGEDEGYLNIGDLSSYFSDEATLSMWMKLDSQKPSNADNTGFTSINGDATSHYPYTDGNLYIATFADSRVISGYDNSGFDKTNWHLVTISTEPGSGNYELYQNGDLVTSGTGPDTIQFDQGYIGYGRGVDAYVNGNIDEVRLYNRSLSESEVEDLYFRGMDGNFNGSYIAKKIDNSQETKWRKVGVNASVPSETALTAEFEALDSDDSVVDRELIDVTGGSSPVNYSLNVQASESARLSFNGTSSNVTKTWKVYDYEVFSGERQVDESESFSVQDGLNEFSLGVNDSRDARIRLNGTTSDVTQSWSVSNMSVFTE